MGIDGFWTVGEEESVYESSFISQFTVVKNQTNTNTNTYNPK